MTPDLLCDTPVTGHGGTMCGAKYHTTHVVGVPLESPHRIHNAPAIYIIIDLIP